MCIGFEYEYENDDVGLRTENCVCCRLFPTSISNFFLRWVLLYISIFSAFAFVVCILLIVRNCMLFSVMII